MEENHMLSLLINRFVKDYDNTKDFKVRNSYGKLASVVGIVLNLILFAIKFIAGTLANAVSIIADAFNNLSDASSSLISLLGFKLAEKPADNDHPYGHGRYEYVAGLAVAVLVAAIGIQLLRTGFDKILHPTELAFSNVTWIILVISILIKLYMMSYNYSIGKKIDSKALIATGDDSRNDSLTTLAVLITGIISVLTNLNIDGIVTLLLSLFILYSAYGLIKDTLDPILGIKPDEETVKMLEKRIMSFDNILGTHDLIIHDYGPGNRFASVHVEMDYKLDVIKAHDIIDVIEVTVLKETGIHLVIHYDPISSDDELVNSMRKLISELVKGIDSKLSIHDLRVVEGVTHTNLVFDLVIPHEFDKSVDSVKQAIFDAVQKENPKLICVIKVEYSFV